MGKNSHILTVSAGHSEGEMAPAVGFTPLAGRIETAITGDVWFGHRPRLETLTAKTASFGLNIMDIMGTISDAAGRASDDAKSDVESLFDRLSGVVVGAGARRITYPPMLQIIPYVIFRWRGKYLRYLRTTTGGDDRLHGKISIGVGGHVDLKDAIEAEDGSIDVQATVEAACRRESKEEIGLDTSLTGPRWVAILYTAETEVDALHLGIVGIYDLSDAEKDQIEANHEIGDHRFDTLQAIAAEATGHNTLETWTRLVIEANPLA